jgi:hypothetical protein
MKTSYIGMRRTAPAIRNNAISPIRIEFASTADCTATAAGSRRAKCHTMPAITGGQRARAIPSTIGFQMLSR